VCLFLRQVLGTKSGKNTTVYKIDTINVDGKPEIYFKCLRILVGERGFEPPTPWSRTRCSTRLSHSPTVIVGMKNKHSPAPCGFLPRIEL
jgi:hypothetical protein